MNDLIARIRAAISDAYYDCRNEGLTMETAADRATDAVVEILNERDMRIAAALSWSGRI